MYVILFRWMYSLIFINDYIKLFTFKIIIEFMYMILFFIHCTDLVEITLQKRNTCFTDNNTKRLTAKIHLAAVADMKGLCYHYLYQTLKPWQINQKICIELSIDPIIKSRKTLVFSKITKSKTPSLMFLLTFTK